jgi:hypothetical protein
MRHRCCCVLKTPSGGESPCEVYIDNSDQPFCNNCENNHKGQSNFIPRLPS